jgi:hypothetical protein
MSQAIATLVADIVTRTASKTKARNGEAEDPNAQLIGLCDKDHGNRGSVRCDGIGLRGHR